jgi:2-hydroxychromene-2-carboxylate isomerase
VLTLHFDYTSPRAAVALLRLQRLADAGTDVRFVGLDVLGLEVAIPPTLDLLADLERWTEPARELGLSMRRPALQPPTFAAHLVGELADDAGLGASWRDACLTGYWEQGTDLSSEGALVELAAPAGLDPAAIVDRLADRRARTTLRNRMATARRSGVGGVPVLEVDGALVPAELSDADLRQLAGH